ncbi:MAG: transposase family protein [Ktedonobacteraceae bacterium]|nr:transposase family protein [Ktedonobacteraceae bacterium]
MAEPTLLPDSTRLHLRLLDASTSTIIAIVATTSPEAACPLCQRSSRRIHSHYVRQIADRPWMGCAVRLELHTRRFFCVNKDCVRQIFTERIPTVVAPYARRTTRLTDVFTLIGFALGGEAGKRLAAGMGLFTSPDTLLGLIRAQPASLIPPDPPPVVPKRDQRTLPPDIRQEIVNLAAEYPAFRPHEMATICFVKFGHQPSPRTIKLVLATGPKPSRSRCIAPFHEITDSFARRRAIIQLVNSPKG